MTSKEFVIWLRGFTEGVHEFAITPKQWEYLKEKLAEVKDDVSLSPFPFGTPNTTPIMPLPHYPNPIDNPYKITCSSGSFGTITTTPGTGYITTYNPAFSGSFFPISSTTYTHPSGSAWSYTTSNEKIF
jgi:hypothetical protein